MLFTAERARAAGIRSAQLRAQRKANELQRRAQAEIDALELVANDPPTFPAELKARVRVQTLETLSRLEEENARGEKVDGAKLDRLASALERLAELERVLDGRPGPGNRRPPREDPPAAKPLPIPRSQATPSPAPASSTPLPAGGPAPLPPAPPSPPRLLSEPPEF